MAVLPLNTFRTVTYKFTNDKPTPVYRCPIGVTAIILMAQIANTGSGTATVTFAHQHLTTISPLIKNALIPTNDALAVLTGRLVVESGDAILVTGDSTQSLQLVMSLVESANS